jgi:hypothetical protein
VPICSEHPTSDDRSAPPLHHGSVCPICQFAGQAGEFILATVPVAIAPAEIGCVPPQRARELGNRAAQLAPDRLALQSARNETVELGALFVSGQM